MALTGVVVAALAGAAWFALSAERRRAASASKLAVLVLRPDRPDCQERIDGGPWSPVSSAALALAAGRHHLELRSAGVGPLWAYEGDIELAERSREERTVTLAAASVPQQRIAVPGEGMLFSMGVAFGLEPSFPVTQAGSYALARWDGRVLAAAAGRSRPARPARAPAAGASREHPDGDAYWRSSDDGGLAIPRHHVVSWWEAEQARSLAQLPSPGGWLEQGQRREQPALALTPALIAAMRDLAGARLPDREQARSRAASSHASRGWCEGAARRDYLSGGPRNALLILLPSEPETAH